MWKNIIIERVIVLYLSGETCFESDTFKRPSANRLMGLRPDFEHAEPLKSREETIHDLPYLASHPADCQDGQRGFVNCTARIVLLGEKPKLKVKNKA